jgi:hypothetical protein
MWGFGGTYLDITIGDRKLIERKTGIAEDFAEYYLTKRTSQGIMYL